MTTSIRAENRVRSGCALSQAARMHLIIGAALLLIVAIAGFLFLSRTTSSGKVETKKPAVHSISKGSVRFRSLSGLQTQSFAWKPCMLLLTCYVLLCFRGYSNASSHSRAAACPRSPRTKQLPSNPWECGKINLPITIWQHCWKCVLSDLHMPSAASAQEGNFNTLRNPDRDGRAFRERIEGQPPHQVWQ